MTNEIDHLQVKLRTVFSEQPWYGASVSDILQGIDSAKAFIRPSQHAHTIAELAAHMLAWRIFLIKRLENDHAFDVDNPSSFQWQTYGESPQKAWERLLAELNQNQEAILHRISKLPPEKLEEIVPGRKYTFRDLIEGVIQHDVYHLGQISLIYKHFSG